MPASVADTIGEMIERSAAQLDAAGVYYGHGTDNAIDEAAALVLHAAGLGHDDGADVYGVPVSAAVRERVEGLLRRRIDERVPAAYLTGEAWFAGLRFAVDSRVLIPRSPFAELINEQFSPWLNAGRVERILEIGTGSGCIAIACALAFPDAEVVATDIDPAALQLARQNVDRHDLTNRVTLLESDIYANVRGRFDLILSNPPYVPEGDATELPAEYHHEPGHGLYAGPDGLELVRRILQDARRHLHGNGMLALEVGAGAAALETAFPRLPFIWPELEYGGEGIGLIAAADLPAED